MHGRLRHRLLLVALTLISIAILPATASAGYQPVDPDATVAVTSPGDTYLMPDARDDSSDDQELDVAGTSSNLDDGFVDLRCYYDGDSWDDLEESIEVAENGAWSAEDVSFSTERMCALRGVPANTDPHEFDRFTGPAIGVGWYWGERLGDSYCNYRLFGIPCNLGRIAVELPELDTLINFDATTEQKRGEWEFDSAGDCGVHGSQPYAGAFFNDEADDDFVDCIGGLPGFNDFGEPTLVVDGHPAFLPTSQARLDGPLEGLADLSVSRSLNTVGNLLLGESNEIQFCMYDGEIVDVEDDDYYDRGGDYCEELAPSGIKLDRTISTEQDGAQARLADRFASTDGKAHDVRIGYVTEFDDADVGLGFNDDPIRQFEEYEIVDFTESPSTVLVHGDMDYIDGSDDTMGGAITYLPSPDRAVFADYDDYSAYYSRSVPASGALEITQVLSHAYTLAEATELANATADKSDLPKVAITAPAAGSVVTAPSVVVTGTASDATGLAGLVLNGAEVPVGGSGAWSQTMPLDPGVNTFTATARDAAGNTSTATTSVTYSPLATAAAASGAAPARTCTVPRVHRRTLLSAERALVRAGCGVKLKSGTSKTIKPGRIISQSVSPGRIVAAGKVVTLRVSKAAKKSKKAVRRSAKRRAAKRR